MSTFSWSDGRFLDDGGDFHLISGALHYFRVPREYWRDRLEKLRFLGCNAVETYVPWNLHEPRPGIFDFAGGLDLEAFLADARSLGLKAIVRPSPYICGEFEFGGLPWWLLRGEGSRPRSLEAPFRDAVTRYYAELLSRLAPAQCTRGGPLILCQVENEYGYFGNEREYLEFLRDELRRGGIEIPLFTVDGPWGDALECGSLEGILAAGSFGSQPEEHFARMRRLHPDQPLFCAEYWMGWFDAWGDEHHERDASDAARCLEAILEQGHVNLYMFHGGTNFGFTSGANHHEEYRPDVTSYDYDAPLSEAGMPTLKYHAFRDVIARRSRDPEARARASIPYAELAFTTPIRRAALGRWPVVGWSTLADALPGLADPRIAARPLCMEELDQGYGYVLYRASLSGPRVIERLELWRCADRAVVYLDGVFLLAQDGEAVGRPFRVELDAREHLLEILVENQGRVNFGPRMDDQRKGLRGAILVDRRSHGPVQSWGLPFHEPPRPAWSGEPAGSGRPGFHLVRFELDNQGPGYVDTFLSLPGWGKGVAWVNGRNLGRFWERGPQGTLYVPGPWLRHGLNELVLFESEGRSMAEVAFAAEEDLRSGKCAHGRG